jgi:two-component system, NarL family, response regulator NreC
VRSARTPDAGQCRTDQDITARGAPATAATILLATPQKIMETGLLALFGQTREFDVVGTAACGRDAVDVASKSRPSMAVVDVRLPDLTAVEVVRRMQNGSPNTRVLALSSDTNWGCVVALFRAGAWGFVANESPFDALTSALRTIMQGHHFVDGPTGGKLALAWSQMPGMTAEIALAALSKREHEVFQLLIEGNNTREITQRLFIARKTAETHRRTILGKLKVRDTADLMRFAVRNRLINP